MPPFFYGKAGTPSPHSRVPAPLHEPAQLDPSLLLVHICGTIYYFIFVTWTIAFRVSPVTENAFVWRRLVTYFYVVRLTNVLTYLLTYYTHNNNNNNNNNNNHDNVYGAVIMT